MTIKPTHISAQAGRTIALSGLQQRKNRGETVGRVHMLPELKAADLDALFAMTFPNADGGRWAV